MPRVKQDLPPFRSIRVCPVFLHVLVGFVVFFLSINIAIRTLLKTGDEHRCSEGLTVPASLVKPVVLLLDTIIPKEIQLKLMKRGLPAKKIEVQNSEKEIIR
jgi:hypothetical protein